MRAVAHARRAGTGLRATRRGAPRCPFLRPFLAAVTALAVIGAAMTTTAQQFTNPVIRDDFPDPFILRADGAYYAFATNSGSRNIQVTRSLDLVSWDVPADAMPALPRWVNLSPAHVWAPEVIEVGGRYLAYFTARDRGTDRQCVGVAVSEEPGRRYRPVGEGPLVCQAAEGGSIDASPFRALDGRLYLYWKNDGNCCGLPTHLYAQELTPDGLGLVGEPVRLLRNDAAWEGRVVEAPTMWHRDGEYYLFYSANDYGGAAYAVGYARCEGPLGPCEKAAENPILASRLEPPLVVGPGHQTIFTDAAGQEWLVYHAWEVTSAGLRGNRRQVYLDRLDWADGRPVVRGPTLAPQPAPAVPGD